MREFLILLYEALTVLLPCALVYSWLRRKGTRPDRLRGIALVLFALYVLGVFHVTGAGTIYELLRSIEYAIPDLRINLMPFSEPINTVGYQLNVVMLVPFGFLAPLLWPRLDRLWRTALAGLSFSLLIELSQLVNYRSSDVDDLLMNTLGAVIGFAAYRLLACLLHRKTPVPAGRAYEPALYIGVMFLGRFLLFNGLGAATLLYG